MKMDKIAVKSLLVLVLVFFSCSILQASLQLRLADYTFNNCSKNGEDGIIRKILETMGQQAQISIEIDIELDQYLIHVLLNASIDYRSAHNTIYYSTTGNLWLDTPQHEAIIINSDEKKCAALKKLNKPNCSVIHDNATAELLEKVLIERKLQGTVDVLAINRFDYSLFNDLTIKPHIIVIPYDSFDPSHLKEIQTIADKKSYKIVEIYENKVYLVTSSYYSLFSEFKLPIL
jgi:hypothetical protein